MATTTITIRTNGQSTVIETTGSTVASVNGDIHGAVRSWTNGITNDNTNGYINGHGHVNGQQFHGAPDVNEDPERVKFAYWVPNVSGGLVISKIPQKTKWEFRS
jgi:hypothetical protein